MTPELATRPEITRTADPDPAEGQATRPGPGQKLDTGRRHGAQTAAISAALAALGIDGLASADDEQLDDLAIVADELAAFSGYRRTAEAAARHRAD